MANEEKSWSRGHFCHLTFAVNANLDLSINALKCIRKQTNEFSDHESLKQVKCPPRWYYVISHMTFLQLYERCFFTTECLFIVRIADWMFVVSIRFRLGTFSVGVSQYLYEINTCMYFTGEKPTLALFVTSPYPSYTGPKTDPAWGGVKRSQEKTLVVYV